MTWLSYWKPLALVLAALLLIGVGAAGGVWIGARHYRPQLDRAAQAVADAQQQAGQRFAAAQRLQQEHAEGEQCAAAEAVIDKELGL